MSRATNQPIVVRPENNIYTVLSGVALVVVILGLVSLWMRAAEVLPGGLFGK